MTLLSKLGGTKRLFISLIVVVALSLCGCGTSRPQAVAPTQKSAALTPLQRERVPNQAGYDRFYDDPRVVRDASKWFDLIYDVRAIAPGDSGHPALVLDVLLYPKYEDALAFWAYAQVDDAILAYVDLNYTTSWADETLIDPSLILGPANWTGYGRTWTMDALREETACSEEKQQALLDVVTEIKMHIVVERDGVREKEIVPLRYVDKPRE